MLMAQLCPLLEGRMLQNLRLLLAVGSLAFVTAFGGATSAAAQSLPAASAESKPSPAAGPGTDFFTDLVRDTIGDFRRVPSGETATWLGVGAAVTFAGHFADRTVTRRLSGAAALDPVFEPGKSIGGARLQLGGALATYAVGKFAGRPRVAQVGADLFRAQVVAQTLTAAVKLSVRRTRPDGSEFSFPSGHTSITFASATVLQRDLGWKVGLPAFGVATYVAASRIQERRHFLSDVAFGAAIGIVAGRTVTIGRGETRFAVAPMAAPGGGGVAFTWVGRR